MAPEFALFLSPDGIALAHRQPKGHWAVLADTPLDVDDLSVALTALRKRAEERADGKFTTLVVLPDDQVLFTSLTAPGPDEEDRLEQIRSGLEGLTPYPVEDLAFDYTPLEYGRVKLAVVARETLAEAESFAKEHGFEPAGFAARPVDNRFPGVALFDREPDWTASLTEIEFGRDSWPKSNAKPAEAEAAAAEPAKEAVPEAEADRAPDKAEDAAKAAATKTKDASAPKDEPKDEPKDRTDPPEAAEGADGPAPDPVIGDAVKAPSKAAKPATGTAAETTRDNAENAAQVQLSALSLPEGFGLRRDRDNPDDAVADRIGSRPPRFGISPPELSRGTATGDDMGDDTGDDTGDRPRFGRGETLPDPLDDPETSPARPSAAGPAPELPPLRTSSNRTVPPTDIPSAASAATSTCTATLRGWPKFSAPFSTICRPHDVGWVRLRVSSESRTMCTWSPPIPSSSSWTLTFLACVDRMLDSALTNTVPTRPESGMNEYCPQPCSAICASSCESRLYPNPNVWTQHPSGWRSRYRCMVGMWPRGGITLGQPSVISRMAWCRGAPPRPAVAAAASRKVSKAFCRPSHRFVEPLGCRALSLRAARVRWWSVIDVSPNSTCAALLYDTSAKRSCRPSTAITVDTACLVTSSTLSPVSSSVPSASLALAALHIDPDTSTTHTTSHGVRSVATSGGTTST